MAVEKSAIAEHSALTNHMVNFKDTFVIRSCNRYYDRLILEAIEINKHKDNINRETATLSTTWNLLLSGLTARGLTERTNKAHRVTPTGQGPLTGPPTAGNTTTHHHPSGTEECCLNYV